MDRRFFGWLLATCSPGIAASTLVLLAMAAKTFFGRLTLEAVGLIVFDTWALATFGTAAGACFLVRRPNDHPFVVIGVGAAGMAVYGACVYAAEHVTPWLP